MRVVVDFDLCESNALCMGLAPEVFEVRDDDLLYVLNDEPPEELREQVVRAVPEVPVRGELGVDRIEVLLLGVDRVVRGRHLSIGRALRRVGTDNAARYGATSQYEAANNETHALKLQH